LLNSRITEEDATEELMLIKAPFRPANSGRLYIPAHAVRRGLRGPFLGTFLGTCSYMKL